MAFCFNAPNIRPARFGPAPTKPCLAAAAVNDGLDLQFFGQLDELTSDGTQRRIPLLAK